MKKLSSYLTRSKKHLEFTRLAVWLVLLCIIANSTPLYGSSGPPSPDAVYCPLQKAWVDRRADVESPKPVRVLDEICSSAKQKKSFLLELSSNFLAREAAMNQDNAEKLYFRFLEKGRRALTEINPSNNGPERSLERSTSKQHGAGTNFTTDLSLLAEALSTLEVLARPPTGRPSTKFDLQIAIELANITRNISPRSPPPSL